MPEKNLTHSYFVASLRPIVVHTAPAGKLEPSRVCVIRMHAYVTRLTSRCFTAILVRVMTAMFAPFY